LRTPVGNRYPIGLFVSFEAGWQAVREFVESEGQLPRYIDWIDEQELPEDAFIDPRDRHG
jgi:hypothetical protein